MGTMTATAHRVGVAAHRAGYVQFVHWVLSDQHLTWVAADHIADFQVSNGDPGPEVSA